MFLVESLLYISISEKNICKFKSVFPRIHAFHTMYYISCHEHYLPHHSFYVDQITTLHSFNKLEAQWAETVSLTCRTNQKQELPIAAMFANGSK